MRNLIALLVRFSSVITFILLELVCFVLIVNYNPSQRDIWINSSNLFSGTILEKKNQIASFFDLEKKNQALQEENAALRETLLKLKGYGASIEVDSSFQYDLIPAVIINQEYRFRNNYITLDKGAAHGLAKDMGVINNDGIVGIIKGSSGKYAIAISMLNTDTRISAKIKGSSFFGNLYWKGKNPYSMTLESIPRYAEISVGDTIVTSGYSTIFPADLSIGVVESFELKPGTSNLDIEVKLSADLTNINTVYVINHKDRVEIKTLEGQYE